jgi:hypothetical protein
LILALGTDGASPAFNLVSDDVLTFCRLAVLVAIATEFIHQNGASDSISAMLGACLRGAWAKSSFGFGSNKLNHPSPPTGIVSSLSANPPDLVAITTPHFTQRFFSCPFLSVYDPVLAITSYWILISFFPLSR